MSALQGRTHVLTRFSNGIGPRGIENIVTKHCKEAHIVEASVHTLRHTMTVEMLRRGAMPVVIGKALGLCSPDTTSWSCPGLVALPRIM